MPFLMVSTPTGDTFRYDIESESARIGRSGDNDLVIPDDEAVSRHQHARLDRRPDGIYLVHMTGKNPTTINHCQIRGPTRLAPGDVIGIGRTELTYDLVPETVAMTSDAWSGDNHATITPGDLGTLPLPHSSRRIRGSLTMDLIAEADRQLVVQQPILEIFEAIMDLARRAVPYERGALLTVEGGDLVHQIVRASPHSRDEDFHVSRAIATHVMSTKQSILTTDVSGEPGIPSTDSFAEMQIRSLMCVPLMKDDDVTGLLYVDSRARDPSFDRSALRLLTHLANVAAAKLENKRLFDQIVDTRIMVTELRRAAEIQSDLLPGEAPLIPGYIVYGSSVPCHTVGGDYYDFLKLGGGRYAVGLGDIAGKGLSAALLMCAFQATVRAVTEFGLPPHETVGKLDRLMRGLFPINRFVTFFYASFDPESDIVTYVNAGQCCPCVIRREGSIEKLPGCGPPLGILDEASYVSRQVRLDPGDLLLTHSDGAIEVLNRDEEQFGEERLLQVAAQARNEAPESMVERLKNAIDDHHADLPPEDDVTFLILKRKVD
ncbi:MAG: SpoIIE family protein phosphatase [Acidobacteriota bacterium]|nr:SpoIIE family protein phosphatase [Acidobacteriota bacterium]